MVIEASLARRRGGLRDVGEVGAVLLVVAPARDRPARGAHKLPCQCDIAGARVVKALAYGRASVEPPWAMGGTVSGRGGGEGAAGPGACLLRAQSSTVTRQKYLRTTKQGSG